MPIRSEAELDRAIATLDALSDRGRLARDEREYLLVLASLVERYEDEHYPMGRVSDVEMLRYLMEAHGATQADVARGSGINVGTVSNLLAGRRPMTRGHIEALARYFRVSPGVFLPDPPRGGG
jgi:HTH-type transcriptional regulator/antitoxin HigA